MHQEIKTEIFFICAASSLIKKIEEKTDREKYVVRTLNHCDKLNTHIISSTNYVFVFDANNCNASYLPTTINQITENKQCAVLVLASADFDTGKLPVTKIHSIIDCNSAINIIVANINIAVNKIGNEQHTKAKIEKELKNSQTRYIELFNNMMNGMAIYKAIDNGNDFIIVDFNNAAQNITKKTKNDVIGRKLSEVFPYSKKFGLLNILKKVWQTGISEFISARNYKDATIDLWFENYIYKLSGGNVVALFNNVTEIKKSEVALANNERKLREIVSGIPVLIVAMDKNYMIKFWNKACEITTGFKAAEIVEKTNATKMLFDVEYLENIKSNLNNLIASKNFELRITTKSNDYRTVRWQLMDETEIVDWAYWAIGIDITNEKKAMDAAIETETRYEELFNNLKSGVAVYEAVENGENFVFRDINHFGLTMSELSTDEVIGNKVTDIFPGVEELGLFDVLKYVWKTGEPKQHPSALYQDNRVVHWVENYVYKLPSGEVVAVYEDVTEIREQQLALSKSEQTLRMIVQNMPVLVFGYSDKNQLKFWNKECENTLGYRSEELINNNTVICKMIPDETQKKRLFEASEYENVNVDFNHKDGSIKTISLTPMGSVKISDWANWFVGIDVTEQFSAQKAMKESEELHKLLFEKMAQGAIYQDEKGNLIDANIAAVDILGLSIAEMKHCIVSDCLWASIDNAKNETEEKNHPVLTAFKNSNNNKNTTLSFYNPKSKSFKWIALHAYTLNNHNAKTNKLILTTFEDITNQKNAEKQILAMLQKEKELSRMRYDFITMASHQFRTPLTIVLSNTELLEMLIKRNSAQLLASANKYLKKIYSELKKFDNILTNILLVGKVENRDIKFSPEMINVEDICKRATAKHYEYQNNRNTNIFISGQPFAIKADAYLLDKAVGNLLSNAYKFSKSNPRMKINYKTESVEITIADCGIGISSSDKSNIFKSFFRATNALDKNGAGLGLLIAKESIEMHNGIIRFESTLGRGSIFTIELPR